MLNCQKRPSLIKMVTFGQLSNKAITEIENFFDWIVSTQSRNGGAGQKRVTSLPGAIAPIKMDILTPNKVLNMATDLLLTSGMINSMGSF